MKPNQKTSVLLVDDRPENLLVLEAILADLDLNLVTALSGEDALGRLLNQEFAIILMDVQMPILSGFETAEIIRGREATRHIPIIFVTAESSAQSQVFRGYESGAVDYLLKPLEPKIVQSKVRVFVELFEQHKQIERASEALRQAQKMEAVGQLTAGIAHDFNNLLQIINGYADIVIAKLDPESSALPAAHEIKNAGTRAKELIQQMLAFSRQQVVDPMDLNLSEVVEETSKMLLHSMGDHIQLKIIKEEKLKDAFLDRGQMQQAMINLCVNARDAMPDGGVLTVETKNITLTEEELADQAWASESEYIMLRVSDTGEGMADDTRERIFEPFFTTKEVGQGSGLGLSSVYGMVQQNGGHISVTSEIGVGTQFLLYFPASQSTEETPLFPPSAPSDAPKGGEETILFAEDDSDVLDQTTDVLRQAGYTVLTAKNGLEAVRVFENNPDQIDFVLTDVMMPKMGGKEAVERMLQLQPTLRHLYISAYNSGSVPVDFIQKKKLPLVSKPYHPEELLGKIREILDAPAAK